MFSDPRFSVFLVAVAALSGGFAARAADTPRQLIAHRGASGYAPEHTRAAYQQEGEGIRLSIVKRLCGLLDATIEVDSKIGEGTTFRVLLPRQYTS